MSGPMLFQGEGLVPEGVVGGGLGPGGYGTNHHVQWRIQDFPEVEAPTLQGAPTYHFTKFSQKLHEI